MKPKICWSQVSGRSSMWFWCWRQDQGWWPSLPTCNFQVGAFTTVNIETRVMSIVSQVDMSLRERQVLQVLTTLQYLAEKGPESTSQTHSMQCTVDHEAPWTNRDFFHASCCVGVWHFSSIKYFNGNKCIMCGHIIATLKHMLSREHASTWWLT